MRSVTENKKKIKKPRLNSDAGSNTTEQLKKRIKELELSMGQAKGPKKVIKKRKPRKATELNSLQDVSIDVKMPNTEVEPTNASNESIMSTYVNTKHTTNDSAGKVMTYLQSQQESKTKKFTTKKVRTVSNVSEGRI